MLKNISHLTSCLLTGSLLIGIGNTASADVVIDVNIDTTNDTGNVITGAEINLTSVGQIKVDDARTVGGLSEPECNGFSWKTFPDANVINDNTNNVTLDYEGPPQVNQNECVHFLIEALVVGSNSYQVSTPTWTSGDFPPPPPPPNLPGLDITTPPPEPSDPFSIFRLDILEVVGGNPITKTRMFFQIQSPEVTLFNGNRNSDLVFTIQSQVVPNRLPTEQLTQELPGFSSPSSIIVLQPGDEINVKAVTVPESNSVPGILTLGILGAVTTLKRQLKLSKYSKKDPEK